MGAAGKGYGQGVKPGTVLWKSHIGTNRFYLPPSLSVDEKLVFVANDHTGKLIAYYTENGNKAWELDSVKSGSFTPIIRENSFIFAFKDSHIGEFSIDGLSKNWELEVGRVQQSYTPKNIALSRSGDIVTISNSSKVSHINNNGQLISDFSYQPGTDSIIYGPEDYVYFWNRSELNCFNLESKKIVWKEKVSDRFGAAEGNPPPILNSKGELIARFLYDNEESKIIKYKGKTGWKVWEYPSEKKFGKYETPTAISIGMNDEIIATTRGGKIFKLNDAGEEIWSFQGDNGSWSVPAISQKGSIYYGTSSKTFFCIDYDNGKEKWKLNLGLSTTDSLITKTGLVLFGGNDGNLYAVQGDAGPMDSAWPMGGQNPQRTNSSKLTDFPDEPDIHQPVITLIGDSIVAVTKGGSVDLGEGATALDDIDGNLTSKIVVSGTYDVNTAGTYELKYDVEDSSGKKADTVTRTIHIVDKATVTTNKKTYWPGEIIKVKYVGSSSYPLGNRHSLKIKITNLETNREVFSIELLEGHLHFHEDAFRSTGTVDFGDWRTQLNTGKYKVELYEFKDWNNELLASDEFTVVPQVLWESKLINVSSASLAISNSGDLIAMSQNKTFSINPKTGSVNWESETYNVNEGDPIVSIDGKIYIPSYKIDILDEVTGKRVLSEGVEIKVSDGIGNSLLTIFDQNKFVTRLMWPKRGVQMVDHSGNTVWEYSIDTENHINHPLIVGNNGHLFGGFGFRIDKINHSKIFCLDGSTGVEKWAKTIKGSLEGGMAFGIHDDLLFIVGLTQYQKHIVSLKSDTGELNWKHDNVERDGSVNLDHGEDLVIDNEGYIHVNSYLPSDIGQDKAMYNSLDGGSVEKSDDDQYWSKKSPILLDDGSRLIQASEALICEDIQSGEQLWAVKGVTSVGAVADDGTIFYKVTYSENNPFWNDSTPSEESEWRSRNVTKIIALAGNAGVADAPWPMNAQNPQNTVRQPGGPITLTKDLPEKVTVREGSNTSLIVNTQGAFPKQWEWYYNGELIPGEKSQFLNLKNVTSENEGTYSVLISNSLGSKQSQKCQVSVLDVNSTPKVLQLFENEGEKKFDRLTLVTPETTFSNLGPTELTANSAVAIDSDSVLVAYAAGPQKVKENHHYTDKRGEFVVFNTSGEIETNPVTFHSSSLTGPAALMLDSDSVFISFRDEGIPYIQGEEDDRKGKFCVFVLNTKEKSVLDNVQFKNLSNPLKNGWELPGALTFYEADVSINNCMFLNNQRGDDYLNIIRSEFDINNTLFKDVKADAFDSDFSKGNIFNSSFINCGNDAIDISGNNLAIENIFMDNIGDKGISAGENSQMIVNNVRIENSEIAICSKDLSKIIVSNIMFINNQIGFTAFQKKSEFGPGSIEGSKVTMENIVIPYLIETHSNCIIDGKIKISSNDKVKDVLYGIKYGKNSN